MDSEAKGCIIWIIMYPWIYVSAASLTSCLCHNPERPALCMRGNYFVPSKANKGLLCSQFASVELKLLTSFLTAPTKPCQWMFSLLFFTRPSFSLLSLNSSSLRIKTAFALNLQSLCSECVYLLITLKKHKYAVVGHAHLEAVLDAAYACGICLISTHLPTSDQCSSCSHSAIMLSGAVRSSNPSSSWLIVKPGKEEMLPHELKCARCRCSVSLLIKPFFNRTFQ